MDQVFIRKDDLNRWIAKYFIKDLISVDDLLSVIEDLDSEVDNLEEKIEDLKNDIESNYKPVSKAEQYDISDSYFH